jgi:hypothetical protein
MLKSTKVSLVAAAVASAMGTSAYALPPAAFTNGTIASTNFFYSGGGSAEPQAVFSAVRSLLTPASVDVYTDAPATNTHPQSANYLVVSGTTNGTGGLAAGTNVAFFYKYNGGSFPNGGLPQVGAGANLAYPAPADLAGASLISPAPATNTSITPNYRYASGNGLSKLPDFGITDEEITLFNFKDNLNGSGLQNLSAGVKATPGWVAPFGIAITANVASGAHPKTKFTRAEVAGVLKGQISDWSQLYADDGSTLSGGPIYLLDRGSGSGTKASGNQFFLNYPGGVATGGALDPNSVSGSNVNSYNGGTTLNTNATDFQDVKEASSAAIVDDLQLANSHGKRAIAVLGLEFPPHSSQLTVGTNDYVFAGINNVYVDSNTGTTDNINNPAGGTTKYSNVITGNYEYAFQVGINTRNNFTQPAFQNAVLNFLKSENVSGAHTGSAFPVSAPGVLLDPKTTNAHDAGNLTWTRGGVSTANPLTKNDASVIGGPVVLGPGDPL